MMSSATAALGWLRRATHHQNDRASSHAYRKPHGFRTRRLKAGWLRQSPSAVQEQHDGAGSPPGPDVGPDPGGEHGTQLLPDSSKFKGLSRAKSG